MLGVLLLLGLALGLSFGEDVLPLLALAFHCGEVAALDAVLGLVLLECGDLGAKLGDRSGGFFFAHRGDSLFSANARPSRADPYTSSHSGVAFATSASNDSFNVATAN